MHGKWFLHLTWLRLFPNSLKLPHVEMAMCAWLYDSVHIYGTEINTCGNPEWFCFLKKEKKEEPNITFYAYNTISNLHNCMRGCYW